MSHSTESRKEQKNTDDPNVIRLGFNISVEGKSTSDVEIYVNDRKQSGGQMSAPYTNQITSQTDTREVSIAPPDSAEGILGERSIRDKSSSSEEVNIKSSNASAELEIRNMEKPEDVTIIDEIKNAMGNFEKFSEHLKDIPRLSTKRMYTSTPYPDKNNSLSEGNLSLYGKTRSHAPKHDFRDRKYFRRSKPLSSDLFLKPLPAEDYFKRGYVRRFYDMESYHHYISMDNLPQYYDYTGECKEKGRRTTAKSDNDKSDAMSSASDVCPAEVKPAKTEATDKQSTSSESAKDIKIYQSGGIIIMQNFNENTDLIEKKDLIDGAKLIESCNKLTEKVESTLQSSDDSQKLLLHSSSDDIKGQAGKIVQFDLSCENARSKSSDSPLDTTKSEFLNSKPDFSRSKEIGMVLYQNQDFTSLSTQENDSNTSNLFGMSPTSSTSGKKLEWDSGADVGYLNMDLSRENLSTIERIILKGLGEDGLSKKQVVFQRNEKDQSVYPTKFVLERMPSELETEGMPRKNSSSSKNTSDQSSLASRVTKSQTSKQNDEYSGRSKQEVKDDSKPVEKHQSTQSDKSNKTKYQAVKQSSDSKSTENQKGKMRTNKVLEKPKKPREKEIRVDEKCVQTVHSEEEKEETTTFSNKSTYVNTLFTDACFDLPLLDISRSDESGRSESSEKCMTHSNMSPRVKKLKKKKNSQGINLTARLRDKIDNIIEMARQSNRTEERSKSLPQDDTIKPMDADQSTNKEVRVPESSIGNSKDKIRSRPISASSSSARTVMPSIDASKVSNALDRMKSFADQIIQTSELSCESKGIQAFQSATSSHMEEGNVEMASVKDTEVPKQCDRTCSKSIQAPGMNSSLPKHLAHPKESFEQLNTKSTQFFGGPITSLPNYHSKEPVVEKVKILKTKTNSDAENNRIRQENVKNSSVKDKQSSEERVSSNKGSKKDKNDPENKENVSVEDDEEFTDTSKKQSNSRKEAYSATNSVGFASCDVQLSDDGKNVFLTSEILKEHDNSIDRNIIKEKYFQSQLIEFGRREMVSRCTSMEKKKEQERNTQTNSSLVNVISVSCQYSPSVSSKSDEVEYVEPETCSKSREEVSEARSSLQNRNDSDKGINEHDKKFEKATSGQNDSYSSNLARTNSSDKNSAISRTLSFEYLPGHVFESTAKEKSPDDTEKNLNIGDSLRSTESQSSPQSENQVKETDSAHTLILEDTYRSLESAKMKSLDSNLTELEMVVSRLHEKETIFQKITDSMLATVSKVNSCGDSPKNSGECELNNNPQGSEEICCEMEISKESEKSDCSKPGKQERKIANEMTAACQTDNVEPHSSQFCVQRRKLEQKMSNEKEQQIKWIENEIKHLHLLRSLLEKQDAKTSSDRRKRHHYLTVPNENFSDTLKENVLRELIKDSLRRISGRGVKPKEPSKVADSASQTVKDLTEAPVADSPCAQFGMALSLRKGKNLQEVTMLPVGVQVTLKDRRCSGRSRGSFADQTPPFIDSAKYVTPCEGNSSGVRQADVAVQYPGSVERVRQDSSQKIAGDESKGRCVCPPCAKSKCICLSNEGMMKQSPQRGNSRQSERFYEECTKYTNLNSAEEFPKISDGKLSDVREGSGRATPAGSVSPGVVSRPMESARQDQSHLGSEVSVNFDKCSCSCHNVPLPRCEHCNLLNTCKKCCCYRKIKCCVCRTIPVQKCFSYSHKADQNKPCRNARLEIKVCSCKENNSSKKLYQEKSSQTEMEKRKCCSCIQKHRRELEGSSSQRESKVPSVMNNAIEVKQAVEEKFSSEMKVPVEKKSSIEVKNAEKVQNEIELRYPETTETVVKEGIEAPEKMPCCCNSNKGRKTYPTEEPYHYFLQLQETTEEESSESGDSNNELDVITIRVPIRKVCKATRNTESRQSLRNAPVKPSYSQKFTYVEHKNKTGAECRCCEDCPGKRYLEAQQTIEEETESEIDQMEEIGYMEDDRCGGYDGGNIGALPEMASGDEYEQRKIIAEENMRAMEVFGMQQQEMILEQTKQCTCREQMPCPPPNTNTDSSVAETIVMKSEPKGRSDVRKEGRCGGKTKKRRDSPTKFHTSTKPRKSTNMKAKAAGKEKCGPMDMYNFNKKEYYTKSELEREEQAKKPTRLTLQQCLTVKRPDLYTRAECRRKIISEKVKDRVERHTKKVECLARLLPQCEIPPNKDLKLFTSKEMKKQTNKFYQNLPEVVNKREEEKKIMQFRTNKLMSELFAKKLQMQTLKGRLNLSNSFTVMSTM
ncbi:UNVERIFIED_CONTAM: hypothetical protein PYX00_004207 [Menopon gallinae]|uniref:ALMS motif domain-containing protein n=1 Tax=Menopon gallinae TaxID=328185 RepID=A0AAW2I3L0_9NEOP